MLELHCNVLGGEANWTLSGQPEPGVVEGTVRLSFGTAAFARITERDAVEQIKTAMRRQKQHWIEPRIGEWRIDLEGLAKLIDTPLSVPWLTGIVSVKPDFSVERRDVRETACYMATVTFYFSAEAKSDPRTTMSLEVFISHSAKDAEISEALIELLRAAMSIPHERIRCSSVDGYRLPGGVTTNEQLKREVREALCFIGLLTPNSLRSPYVLFELGARWGAQLHFVPLVALGTIPSDLRPPLTELNALACYSASQLHQLVSELASALGRKLASAAAYEKYLQRVIAIAQRAASGDDSAATANIDASERLASARSEQVLTAIRVDDPPLAGTSMYPSAAPVANKEGFVVSPYAPATGYVDVRGMPAETLVRCPYTAKIFRVP